MDEEYNFLAADEDIWLYADIVQEVNEIYLDFNSLISFNPVKEINTLNEFVSNITEKSDMKAGEHEAKSTEKEYELIGIFEPKKENYAEFSADGIFGDNILKEGQNESVINEYVEPGSFINEIIKQYSSEEAIMPNITKNGYGAETENIFSEISASRIVNTKVNPNINVRFGDIHETADVKKLAGEVTKMLKEAVMSASEGVHW